MSTRIAKKNKARKARPGSRRGKIGLALDGGGGKGSYQIGCWKAFIECGIGFELVSGCSIGALNGAFICQGDYRKAEAFWLNLSTEKVCRIDPKKVAGLLLRFATDLGLLLLPVPAGRLRALRYARYAVAMLKTLSRGGGLDGLLRKGFFDLSEAEGSIGHFLDISSLRRGSPDLYISVYRMGRWYRLERGRALFYRASELDRDLLKQMLAASVAIPLLFPSMEVNRSRYLDGQLGGPDLTAPMVERGIETVYMIHLRPKAMSRPVSTRHPRVIHLFPSEDLGGLRNGTLDFQDEGVRRRIRLGYTDAMKMLKGG